MDRKQLIERLDGITEAAAQRMSAAPSQPELVYAEIMWMTQEEVAERHSIVMQLQATEDSPAASHKRILDKRNDQNSRR